MASIVPPATACVDVPKANVIEALQKAATSFYVGNPQPPAFLGISPPASTSFIDLTNADVDTMYPVLFDTRMSWSYGNVFNLRIFRSDVNEGISRVNSLPYAYTCNISGHLALWGNDANFLNFSLYNAPYYVPGGPQASWAGNYTPFYCVGGVYTDYRSCFLVVYLRGGLRHYWSGTGVSYIADAFSGLVYKGRYASGPWIPSVSNDSIVISDSSDPDAVYPCYKDGVPNAQTFVPPNGPFSFDSNLSPTNAQIQPSKTPACFSLLRVKYENPVCTLVTP